MKTPVTNILVFLDAVVSFLMYKSYVLKSIKYSLKMKRRLRLAPVISFKMFNRIKLSNNLYVDTSDNLVSVAAISASTMG